MEDKAVKLVKNNYKCICARCRNKIVTQFKVRYHQNYRFTDLFYHLNCFKLMVDEKLAVYQKYKKRKTWINKYKKHMILEKL